MFSHIMVPYELSARGKPTKAVKVAVDLVQNYGARMTLINVGGGIDGTTSHSAEEQRRLLASYAANVSNAEGINVESRLYEVPDPSVEVDRKLIEAIDDVGADLVVMDSHHPGWVEYLINSHAGRVAAHAKISVFVVRD